MCIRRNALVSRLSASALIRAPDFVQFGAQISQKGDGARPVSIGENWAFHDLKPNYWSQRTASAISTNTTRLQLSWRRSGSDSILE